MADESDHTLESKIVRVGGEKAPSSVHAAGNSCGPTKQVPHYLRASTGSCHDACKYGKPQVFKNKPWRTMRKRVSAPAPDTEKPEEIQIFIDRKVKVALKADKLDPLFTQETPLPVDDIKDHIPSSRKSTEPNYSRPIKQERKPFRKSPSPEAPNVMKKAVRSPGKSPLSDTLKPVKREVTSAPKRDVSTKRASSNVKERSASAGPSKSYNSVRKPSSSADSSIGSGGKQSHKTASVNTRRTSGAFVRKDITPPAAVLPSKRASKVEVKRTLNSSVTGSMSSATPRVKAGSSSSRKKTSPKDPNLRSRASHKNQIITDETESVEPSDEKVEEKTLHMIETREDSLPNTQNENLFIQSPSPLSPESLNSSSQANSHSFTSHEVNNEQDLGSEYTDSETDGSVVDSSTEEIGKVNHLRALESGDGDPETMKLKFRRGKIIDPQTESSSPRRLRFKQGANMGDNQGGNGGPRRRSYRRRASDGDKKEAETAPVKVVLKHQEIEEKKDMQVLLNNVIEETASKLVETRKSKVKALVGAFETVISLQESKSSPPHAAANNG